MKHPHYLDDPVSVAMCPNYNGIGTGRLLCCGVEYVLRINIPDPCKKRGKDEDYPSSSSDLGNVWEEKVIRLCHKQSPCTSPSDAPSCPFSFSSSSSSCPPH